MDLINRGQYRHPEMIEREFEHLASRIHTWPKKMTTTQRDRLEGVLEGTTIYNTTTHKLNVYTGSAWEVVTSA